MTEPQKDIPTKGKQLATKDTKPKTKPGPNNPEQAEAFSTQLKDMVDLSEARIHTYDRYETEKAYPEFVSTYHKLLSEVEDYCKHAIPSVVLDIIPDKMAKMMRVEMAWEKEDQAKCPDPRSSADNVPSGHQMLNKLTQLPNFKPFKSGHEKSIVQLCVTLQCTHNMAAEVAGHLVFLGHTLHPDQFSFILKHSVCPLVQISVPPGLSDPTHLQFEHPTLSEEERFEEKAINSVLPCHTIPIWKSCCQKIQSIA